METKLFIIQMILLVLLQYGPDVLLVVVHVVAMLTEMILVTLVIRNTVGIPWTRALSGIVLVAKLGLLVETCVIIYSLDNVDGITDLIDDGMNAQVVLLEIPQFLLLQNPQLPIVQHLMILKYMVKRYGMIKINQLLSNNRPVPALLEQRRAQAQMIHPLLNFNLTLDQLMRMMIKDLKVVMMYLVLVDLDVNRLLADASLQLKEVLRPNLIRSGPSLTFFEHYNSCDLENQQYC